MKKFKQISLCFILLASLGFLFPMSGCNDKMNEKIDWVRAFCSLTDAYISKKAVLEFEAGSMTDKYKFIDTEVTVNGIRVFENSDGNYSVALSETENTVSVKPKGYKVFEKSYTVYYRPESKFPTLDTSLIDNKIVRGSKLTFDVWARDWEDDKIICSVSLNGKSIPFAWNDDTKTSFNAILKVGENILMVSTLDALSRETVRTYILFHPQVGKDGVIGSVAFTIELFSIYEGKYLIEPYMAQIKEGQNGAEFLLANLNSEGYGYTNKGTVESAFYLAEITSGIRPLDYVPNIPENLLLKLKENGFTLNLSDYDPDAIGELNYTKGSGWMYCVNNIFPNVGFSDFYFADGDVIRVQYTLAYGSDIGGGGALGTGSERWFPAVSRDLLTMRLAEINTAKEQKKYGAAYNDALDTVSKLGVTQAELNTALKGLS